MVVISNLNFIHRDRYRTKNQLFAERRHFLFKELSSLTSKEFLAGHNEIMITE